VAWRRQAAVAVGSPSLFARADAKPDRLRAFDGAAFRAPRAEPSLLVLASAPSRNNPVTGGVLLTGAASEMPAGWTSAQSRQSRLRSRWRRYPGS
jgi:hypothetical protein